MLFGSQVLLVNPVTTPSLPFTATGLFPPVVMMPSLPSIPTVPIVACHPYHQEQSYRQLYRTIFAIDSNRISTIASFNRSICNH